MKYALAILLLISACTNRQAQNNKDNTEDIGTAIENQHYEFVARDARPTSGRVIQLTTRYFLDISTDTISGYLPYFGQAYTAPLDPTKIGFDFVSTHFAYNKKPLKKGGWSIAIKPADTDIIQQMFLNLSPSGYGSLQVTARGRQSISYNGYIQKIE